MTSPAKFFSAIVLLSATALFLQARNRREVLPQREPLPSFPHQLGDWTGSDVAIPQDSLEVLGAGEFMLRLYRNQALRQPNVDLFVAYFPTQRAGDTIHSPKNCLPGAGWSPVQADRISISVPGHESFPANRYIIAKGDDRELVLYWYWAHDRAVASEYWAKFYLVADAMRMNRSDGSLVRITTPLASGETAGAAQQRLLAFAGNVVPLLNRYVPR
jgi:EpsI family protein